MKIIFMLLIILSSNVFAQSNGKYEDKEFENNAIIFKTITEINDSSKSYNFQIERNYAIKSLLDKINFYEKISQEILNTNDLNVRKGLIKSVIISLNSISQSAGVEFIKESDSAEDIFQILQGSLKAQRRMLVLQMWTEYNHFLADKKLELINK